jgi:hypothetical protein
MLLLAPAGYRVVRPPLCRPLGADSVEEYTLPAFWREHCNGWVKSEALDDWCVADHYKNPTCDLIVVCKRDTQRGLLLVEAKAHESELDWKGKRALAPRPTARRLGERPLHPGRYRRSAGLVHTGRRADEADSRQPLPTRESAGLRVQGGQRGGAVVLLYLGFTGDTYFTDHLLDANHWQELMRGYLKGVVPSDLPGRVLPHVSGGSLTFLVGALPVSAVSRRPRN